MRQQKEGQEQMSNSERNIKMVQQYKIYKDRILGKGTFGYVFQGENTKNKQIVAIKMVPLKEFKFKPEKIIPSLKNEIKNMQMLHHKNTVQLYDVIKTDNNLYMVVEFCNQGNLDKYIKQKNLSEEKCINIMFQIVEGFKCLNQNNIVHRDLKPENILLHDKTVKIADFGFSKVVEAGMDEPIITSFVGTPLYMSPQILQKQNYSSKTDIWSLGMIFYELIYTKRAWEGKSYCDLLDNILKKPLQFPEIPKVHQQTKQIIRRMLQQKEEDRISWEELFQFFSVENLRQVYSDFSNNSYLQHQQNLQLNQLYDQNQKQPHNPSSPTSTFSMKSEKIDEEEKQISGFSDKIHSDTNLNRMDEESNGSYPGIQQQKSQDSQDNDIMNESQMNGLLEYFTQNINVAQQFQLVLQLQQLLNRKRGQKLTITEVKQMVMDQLKPQSNVNNTQNQQFQQQQARGGLFANSNLMMQQQSLLFNRQNQNGQGHSPFQKQQQDQTSQSQQNNNSIIKQESSQNGNGNEMNFDQTYNNKQNGCYNIDDID
ncbi:Serine/Threonine kinase domain protein (macronuclear) [Tetrahymena thermophila SB210]|uniref:Serine/Threonine kinase domain protein n=1 Tax=Tetrahymena thermophila (strain SB210) TaxID=312017 RepID=I7M973_TETTS|nr:Serine/Threonine kinase domain protein [Tetrahymena thermophila SB210]EAS01038.1 Serine/Threonine kinase domain protein [Tetrahymena thermophila SB210]|eukprot:XP_001021283.1 Serine/Threonine kinase domain protein [Tetrahymena thermophila SB210]